MSTIKQTSKHPAVESGSRHTPGPWRVTELLSGSENDKGFGLWGGTTERRGSYWLGELSPICDGEGNASEEGKANARLIAAAPELLEAIEQIANYLELVETPYAINPEERRLGRIARAAIRKAEEGQ